jgi:uncharacterized protein YdeI (YjbR/CyaY-like superfamily)
LSGQHLPVDGADHDHIPEELQRALDAAPDARKAFDAMPSSHRREYVDFVGEAKKSTTRERRAERALEMIRAVARGV